MTRGERADAATHPALAFLVRVVVIHTLTYLVAGTLAASVLDYRRAFEQPVVRDYMVAFGSASVFWGPFAQPLRGLVIGLTLLPLRGFLAGAKRGWLVLWLLLVGLGIVSTPAAAPSSLEGVIYTRLPGWYHLFGLPEMLLQTLAFSVLVHRSLRRPTGTAAALPAVFGAVATSFAGACFAFIGYAVVSVVFALVSQADLTDQTNLSLRTQGLFIAPFLLNFAVMLAFNLGAPARRPGPTAVFALVLLSNAVAILLYQALVLGGATPVYAILSPVLPAAILAALSFPRKGSPEALKRTEGL